MKLLQVSVADEQLKALKLVAVKNEMTVSDIIRELLDNYLGGGVG